MSHLNPPHHTQSTRTWVLRDATARAKEARDKIKPRLLLPLSLLRLLCPNPPTAGGDDPSAVDFAEPGNVRRLAREAVEGLRGEHNQEVHAAPPCVLNGVSWDCVLGLLNERANGQKKRTHRGA